jgi:hypothetical protein
MNSNNLNRSKKIEELMSQGPAAASPSRPHLRPAREAQALLRRRPPNPRPRPAPLDLRSPCRREG